MTNRGRHLDHLSLDQLCKPLSARVMPRTAVVPHTGTGVEISQAQALAEQRKSAGVAFTTRRKKK